MKLIRFMPLLHKEFEMQLNLSTFKEDQIRIIMENLSFAETVVLRRLLDKDDK